MQSRSTQTFGALLVAIDCDPRAAMSEMSSVGFDMLTGHLLTSG